MQQNQLPKKERIISTLLYLGVIFYLVGAAVHLFGITLFPWFVSALFSPYHDTLIAIASLGMAILFLQGARHPNNQQLVDTIMYIALICSPLIIAMGLLVDFHAYGSGAEFKSFEAVIEGMMGIALGVALRILRKSRNDTMNNKTDI